MFGFYWEGRSIFDGSSIVVVLTRRSRNVKTGDMVQSWIMSRRVPPHRAQATGRDIAVCARCPRRPLAARAAGIHPCYVRTARAPLSVWRAYRAGNYRQLDIADLRWLEGRLLRIGAYGDPVAAGCDFWDGLLAHGRLAGWTGYTHAWRHPQAVNFRGILMASVDSREEAVEARDRGWKTFRVRRTGETLLPWERVCPASKEAGKRLTCRDCKNCDGRRGHRAIVEH